jgi:hypothetical protein
LRFRYHFAHYCGVGWHDTSTAVPIKSEELRAHESVSTFKQLAFAAGLAAVGLGGLVLAAPTTLLLRWALGAALGLSFFNAMDSAMKLVYIHCCNVKVQGLFGDFSRVHTLRTFWGQYWNIPIIDLLGNGVYKPLAGATGSSLAKVAVFAVSGMGHTYALNCIGQPRWVQVSIMSFFLLQVPVLALEAALGLRGKAWTLGALAMCLPLAIEPFLVTAGL